MAKPAIDLSALSPSDKLELIDELWVSLGPGAFELTQEQRQELDRRLDRLDREAPSGASWASVREQVAKAKR
jgi:putative addiction module component (TIGR02574 family)